MISLFPSHGLIRCSLVSHCYVPMMAPCGLKECKGWYVEVGSMELRWVHSRPDMAFTSPNHSASALGKRGEEKRLTFSHSCLERRPGIFTSH